MQAIRIWLTSLRDRLFLSKVFFFFWVSVSISNLGTWLYETGAAWVMTSMSKSPVLMGWLLASGFIPVIVLAPIAGAITDRVDLRRFLLMAQTWMFLVMTVLGVLTLNGHSSPELLIGLALLLALGAAASNPGFHALLPRLLEPEHLAVGISRYYTGNNMGRAIGPALAGLILSFWSPATLFFLNALSFGMVIVFLLMMKTEKPSVVKKLNVFTDLREGAVYGWQNHGIRSVLTHVFMFTFSGTALWTLIPTLARHDLHMESRSFGFLMSLIGIGAIGSGIVMSTGLLQKRVRDLRSVAILCFAGGTGLLSATNSISAHMGAVLAGAAWICFVSTVSSSIQQRTHADFRGRVMSWYVTIFYSGLTLGSLVWSSCAKWWGVGPTYAAVSVALVAQAIRSIKARTSNEADRPFAARS